MRPFQFLQPRSLDEAVDLLARSPGSARLIAGGSDLLDEIKHGLISPDSIISLSGLPGLAEITVTDRGFRIGAMATIADVGNHPHVAETYRHWPKRRLGWQPLKSAMWEPWEGT